MASQSRASSHEQVTDEGLEEGRDADDETDAALAKQHSRPPTLRGPSSRKNKSIHKTARGQSVFWTPEDEQKHMVKAFVRDTAALQASHKWEELVGKGITHLIIEDDENSLKEIPEEICRIQTLRSFTLMWSKIKLIPDYVFSLQLKELCLHKCPLKHVDRIHLMSSLNNLELVNDGLKKIPMEIGELTSLVALDLTGNQLKMLPISIGNLTRLNSLKVCGNVLTSIPTSIVDLPRLQTLDLSQNHIKSIPEDIGDLANLVTLRLSHNMITVLPLSCQKLIKLRNLYLGYNRFTEVPRLLEKLPRLQILNMVSNHVSKIPCPLVNLTTLLLDRNELKELSEPLFQFSKLEKLSVQHNKLTTIPSLIAHLDKLRAVYLGGNSITHLPDDICMLSNLRHLVVRETKVQELPMNFDSLNRLSVVDIEQTELDAMYAYALKNDGIEGLLHQVRLKRELSGKVAREEASYVDGQSDRGSSLFDSEDEPVSDCDVLDEDDGGKSSCGKSSSGKSIGGYSSDILRDGKGTVTSRRQINTIYPQDDDSLDLNANQSADQLPVVELFQPSSTPTIPDEHQPKEMELMHNHADDSSSAIKTKEETSFIIPVHNSPPTSTLPDKPRTGTKPAVDRPSVAKKPSIAKSSTTSSSAESVSSTTDKKPPPPLKPKPSIK